MASSNMNQVITCPECGNEIPLTEALTKHIEADLEKKYKTQYAERLKEHDEKMRAKVKEEYDEKFSADLTDLKTQVKEKQSKIEELNKRELDLKSRERAIDEKEKEFELNVERKIEEMRKQIENEFKGKESLLKEKINKSVSEEFQIKLNDLEEMLNSKDEKLKKANERESMLLKKQTELEEKERELKLTVERQISEERAKIYNDAQKSIEQKFQLKDKEKDELISRLKKQTEELSRKLESGSQQLQGEAQEMKLEDFLRSQFVYDEINPVPVGMRGADVIQTVKTQFGQECGKIIWESKRTAKWSDQWISKLKDDQRDARADIPVIVSQALPEDINNIGVIDGVWIVSFESVLGVAALIREQLLQLERVKTSQVGKNEKMEAVYDYLCSNEFRQKMEGIIDAFTTMKDDLDSEKRAFQKQWNKREKQIENVIKNTAGMYGDLQGLAGTALPSIDTLELPEADEDQLELKESSFDNGENDEFDDFPI